MNIIIGNSQLVSWLKERGIEGETADYATLANVQDKHVYGVMVPLAIAAHAASVTLVDIIGDSMQSFVVVDMTDGLPHCDDPYCKAAQHGL